MNKDSLNFLPFADINEISSLSSKDTSETNDSKSKKKGGGRKFTSVWEHVIKGIEISRGRYKATCIYCQYEWSEGRPQKMRQHLASHCEKCPENIAHIFAKEVANEIVILDNEEILKNNKKRIKVDSKQTNMYQHYDNSKITNSRQKIIDSILIKLFVCCNIVFAIIENPFFMDLLKIYAEVTLYRQEKSLLQNF